jgi:hypothetical protein
MLTGASPSCARYVLVSRRLYLESLDKGMCNLHNGMETREQGYVQRSANKGTQKREKGYGLAQIRTRTSVKNGMPVRRNLEKPSRAQVTLSCYERVLTGYS